MYAQLYIFVSHEDLQRRLNFPTTELDSIIMSSLTNMLDRDSELVKTFKQARDRLLETRAEPRNFSFLGYQIECWPLERHENSPHAYKPSVVKWYRGLSLK